MFKYGKRIEEERQYYEELLARSEQRQTTNLVVGLIVGAAAGYCAKKFVIPKLAEVEYKERLSAETEALKERFNDLKHSVLSLKDRLPFVDSCCCCCDDDCCDDDCCNDQCCDDENCNDGCCEDNSSKCCCCEPTDSEEVLEETPEEADGDSKSE